MKNRLLLSAAGMLVALLSAPGANAQCPLATLSGTWVFSTSGFSSGYLNSPNLQGFQFLGSAGTFTASLGTDPGTLLPIGVLNITETAAVGNSSIARLETSRGRYQIDATCTGGTLTFYVGSRPVQFDFFFINSTEMYLVATQNGDVVTGTARLQTVSSCAGTQAAAVAGNFVFTFAGFQLAPPLFSEELASAGRFAFDGNGVVNVTQSAGLLNGNVRSEMERGTVLVNSSCTGGSMTFALSGRPIQFDFFFVNPNRLTLVGSYGSDIIIGDARRLGI